MTDPLFASCPPSERLTQTRTLSAQARMATPQGGPLQQCAAPVRPGSIVRVVVPSVSLALTVALRTISKLPVLCAQPVDTATVHPVQGASHAQPAELLPSQVPLDVLVRGRNTRGRPKHPPGLAPLR